MEKGQARLWRVEVTVEPKIEWEKIGIDRFQFNPDESITLENQFENKTQLSITVFTNDTEVHNRAGLLMKSFLACLDLEAKREYRFTIGHMRHVPLRHAKEARIIVDSLVLPIARVFRRFEDLDLRLLRGANNSLKVLDKDKRGRVLEALNFLHDALTAATDVQSFLVTYGGLVYLTTSVGRKEKAVESADEALLAFRNAGVLSEAEQEEWQVRFRHLHTQQYAVIKSNKVDKESLAEIKMFFEELLLKYMEYARLSR